MVTLRGFIIFAVNLAVKWLEQSARQGLKGSLLWTKHEAMGLFLCGAFAGYSELIDYICYGTIKIINWKMAKTVANKKPHLHALILKKGFTGIEHFSRFIKMPTPTMRRIAAEGSTPKVDDAIAISEALNEPILSCFPQFKIDPAKAFDPAYGPSPNGKSGMLFHQVRGKEGTTRRR